MAKYTYLPTYLPNALNIRLPRDLVRQSHGDHFCEYIINGNYFSNSYIKRKLFIHHSNTKKGNKQSIFSS